MECLFYGVARSRLTTKTNGRALTFWGSMSQNAVKAAVMTAPGHIETQEFPYPEVGDDAMVIALEGLRHLRHRQAHLARRDDGHGGTPAETTTPFPIIPGHEIVGTVAEIGRNARTRLEYTGKPLNIGDRVVMCPDILRGRCWYCRNAFGFPLCEKIRGYGNHSTATEAPHLRWVAGPSTSTSGRTPSSTRCRIASAPRSR